MTPPPIKKPTFHIILRQYFNIAWVILHTGSAATYHPESIFQYSLWLFLLSAAKFISWTQCVFSMSPAWKFVIFLILFRSVYILYSLFRDLLARDYVRTDNLPCQAHWDWIWSRLYPGSSAEDSDKDHQHPPCSRQQKQVDICSN